MHVFSLIINIMKCQPFICDLLYAQYIVLLYFSLLFLLMLSLTKIGMYVDIVKHSVSVGLNARKLLCQKVHIKFYDIWLKLLPK